MEHPHASVQLNDEQISQFQKLYLEYFGTHITKEEAATQGIALVLLIKAIAGGNHEAA